MGFFQLYIPYSFVSLFYHYFIHLEAFVFSFLLVYGIFVRKFLVYFYFIKFFRLVFCLHFFFSEKKLFSLFFDGRN